MRKSINISQQINSSRKNKIVSFHRCSKVYDGMRLPFLMKTLKEIGMNGCFVDIIKHTHLNPKAHTRGALAGLGNKARMPTISTTTSMLLEMLVSAMRQEGTITGSSSVSAGSYSVLHLQPLTRWALNSKSNE